MKERKEQGGFTSVQDFGESIGLQPHEIVRLRRAATCSPRPRDERTFSRRVDYRIGARRGGGGGGGPP